MIRQIIWLLLIFFVGRTDPAEGNLDGVALPGCNIAAFQES